MAVKVKKEPLKLGEDIEWGKGKNNFQTTVIGFFQPPLGSYAYRTPPKRILIELPESKVQRFKNAYNPIYTGKQLKIMYKNKQDQIKMHLVEDIKHYAVANPTGLRRLDPFMQAQRAILNEIYVGRHTSPSGVLIRQVKK
jgi:hypothetical protein